MKDSSWDQFLVEAAEKMHHVLENKITIDEASKFFENTEAITSDDLRQFVVRYIWEIDGYRSIYMEILKLLEENATQDQLVEYFKN